MDSIPYLELCRNGHGDWNAWGISHTIPLHIFQTNHVAARNEGKDYYMLDSELCVKILNIIP